MSIDGLTLQRALHEQALQSVLVRLNWCIDHGQLDGLVQVLHPQVQWVRPGGQVLLGPQAVLQAYAQREPDRITRHLLTNMHVGDFTPQRAQVHSTVLLWSGSLGDALTPAGRPAHAEQKLGEHTDVLVFDQDRWWLRERQSRFVLYR